MDKSKEESCECGCEKEHVKGHMGGHMKGHWRGKGPHEWDADKLKEKLGLTDEQVAELKGLKDQKMELRRQYKEANEKGDDEAIAKLKAQKEELWKQMKGILKESCEGKEAKSHWGGKRPHGFHEWDSEKLKQRFDLTDEEVAEVKRLWKQIRDILKE